MNIEIEIKNLPQFIAFFEKQAPDAVTDGVSSAMADVAQGIYDTTTSIVPVDTGALRDSIEATSSGDTIIAHAGMEYASYVDEGTSKMAAQPYFTAPIEGIAQGLNEVIERTLRQTGVFD